MGAEICIPQGAFGMPKRTDICPPSGYVVILFFRRGPHAHAVV